VGDGINMAEANEVEKVKRARLNYYLYPEKIDKKKNPRLKFKIKLTEKQLKVLRDFDKFNAAKGLTIESRINYTENLRYFADSVKKDFKDMKETDVLDYLASIDHMAERTKQTKTVIIKYFFKWFYKTEDYPEVVMRLVTNRRVKRKIKLIWTPEEVKRLIDSADNLRDRSLLFVLYCSAARRGELMRLRIRDVQFDRLGAKVKLSGKTGERLVRVIDCVPTLKEYLNQHPFKDESNAFLFHNFRRKGQQLKATTIFELTKRAAKVSGIKKNIYPHCLRRSRLQHLSDSGFNSYELMSIAGWSNIRTSLEYVRSSSRAIDQKFRKQKGLLKEKEKEDVMQVKICYKCRAKNSYYNKFCSECQTPLDVKIIIEIDQKREQFYKEFDEMMPVLREVIADRKNIKTIRRNEDG